MKIAVSAPAPALSGPVDPRFGRCAFFLFIDSETMQYEAIENPNITSLSGAGIQSAQLVAEKGANVLLTGSCGPKAFQTLQAAGVKVVAGVRGSVEEAVQHFKSGQLEPAFQPDVPPHSGMNMGGGSPLSPGVRMGRGGSRGMSGGMGRGMRMGVDRGLVYGHSFQGPGTSPPNLDISRSSPEEQLQQLKQQAELLHQQMESLTKKINDIEKKNK